MPGFIFKLNRNLVYSTEAQFAMCLACTECLGTGQTKDQSKQWDPTYSFAEKACEKCQGRGHTQQFLSMSELVEAVAPALYDSFLKRLPNNILDAIEEGKIALVRSIMES